MLVPIEAATRLLAHTDFTSAALDEAVTAFNAELAAAFAAGGQVIGIPESGIANVIKVEAPATGSGTLQAVTAAVTLAVLTEDPDQVDVLAAQFHSTRFPNTTFRVTGRSRMDHLRGMGQFTATQVAAHEHAAARISGIVDAT
jgi:hypothetical protein